MKTEVESVIEELRLNRDDDKFLFKITDNKFLEEEQ
jgi:hypothetical protein